MQFPGYVNRVQSYELTECLCLLMLFELFELFELYVQI